MSSVELRYTDTGKTEVFSQPGSYELKAPEGYKSWGQYTLEIPEDNEKSVVISVDISGEVSRIRLRSGQEPNLPAQKDGNLFSVWGILTVLSSSYDAQ